MKSKIIFFVFCLLVFSQSFSFAVTLTVTNCADGGAGSLRQALTDVTTGDAIEFNIPWDTTASTGEYSAGVVTNEAGSNKWFRIIVDSALPTISKDNVYIKGFSQPTSEGNNNSLGPEVEIRGASGASWNGLYFSGANNCTIEGLAINDFLGGLVFSGIYISSGNSNEIVGNYIGVDASGTMGRMNGEGIYIDLSFNNKIGNGTVGGRNVISGNVEGIEISFSGSNEVLGNYIGLDATGTIAIANGYGIHLFSSSNNTIGASNVIAYNGSLGVLEGICIEASDSIQNKITQNSMYSNYGKGISLEGGTNENIPTPEITSVTYTGTSEMLNITGTGTSNAVVEIFKASGNQGRYYLGSVESNALGSFETTLDISSSGVTFITGETVTTTQTDANNNTSEFSNTKEVAITSFVSTPPTLELPSNNLFKFGPNPYNPNNGSARIWYWLSSSADTTIYIMNMNGVLVWKNTYLSGTNGGQAGENNVEFNGKNSWGDTLGNGAYLFKVVQGGRVVGGGKIAVIR
ncbi:hypothetical protein A3J90_03105 [candidate division WOR-1 bacterium RIFOXYC2_FULL_37_10]|nr:MAG: hypothetical protein A3J90_03105 [candidate division WOR-1 bacterium RIFOXYC2_FULL_37_10]